MELLEAYRVIPAKGSVVRLYEFRGQYHYLVDPAENGGHPIKIRPKGKLKYVGVVAENLYDAVVHLHLLRPEYFPDRVMCRAEMPVELKRWKDNRREADRD